MDIRISGDVLVHIVSNFSLSADRTFRNDGDFNATAIPLVEPVIGT